jgi:hypothetical protein
MIADLQKGKKNKKATQPSAEVAAASTIDPAEHSVESAEVVAEPVIESVSTQESNDESIPVAAPEQPIGPTLPESEQGALEQAPLQSTLESVQPVHDAIQEVDATVVVHVDLEDDVDVSNSVDATHVPAVAVESSVDPPVQADPSIDSTITSNTPAVHSTAADHYESLETFTHHRSHSESNLLESAFVPISPLRRVEITNCSHAVRFCLAILVFSWNN